MTGLDVQCKPLLFVVLLFFISSTVISEEATDKKKQASAYFPDIGQKMELTVGGKACPVLLFKAKGKSRGAVIIIQGKKERDYEADVIFTLRKQLARHGYTTMGINIPGFNIEANNKTADIMSAAITYFMNKKTKKVFVLLHGEGAGELLSVFMEKRFASTSGLVLLSAYTDDKKDYEPLIKNLKAWFVPVLDIKAQFDFSQVDEDFIFREKLFNGFSKRKYRQIVIEGAGVDYLRSEEALVKWLRGWFAKQKLMRALSQKDDDKNKKRRR